MRIIKKEVDYASQAIIFINKSGATDVKKVALGLRAPKPFMRKILQTLAKGGILTSSKGKNGGFALLKPFNDITLKDLTEIFEENKTAFSCPFGNDDCHIFKNCILRKKIGKIQESIYEAMSNIYMKDLSGHI